MPLPTGFVTPIAACGAAPADEPTCVPSRPDQLPTQPPAFTGIRQAGDRDGDGVEDSADNCPDVFNPPLPISGFLQEDTDGDGRGDPCDGPLSELVASGFEEGFAVAVNVSGLTSAGLSLRLNNGAILEPGGNGLFQFTSTIETGHPYDVGIVTQPADQHCTLSEASGIVGTADVELAVLCIETP
jgi:hypothetical protein